MANMLAYIIVQGFLTLACTLCLEERFFQKYELPSESYSTVESAQRSMQCAIACMDEPVCFGYQFAPDSVCRLSKCLNPNLLTPANGTLLGDTYLSLDHPEINTSLALKKPAHQSTTLQTLEASRANDGIYELIEVGGDIWSMSLIHTLNQPGPWWRVDLEDLYCIWAVKILNRGGDFADSWKRTKNAIITVSDDVTNIFWKEGEEDNFCNYYDGTLDRYYTLITCGQAIIGQFVQIQLNGTATLNIYEVEVHGI